MKTPFRVSAAPAIRLACAAGLILALSGCSNDAPREVGWTIERAESVTTIRGMTVRAPACLGRGAPVGSGKPRRFRRFDCEARARPPGESRDTVGVYYEIRLDAAGGYVLDDVRFIGPGVP